MYLFNGEEKENEDDLVDGLTEEDVDDDDEDDEPEEEILDDSPED